MSACFLFYLTKIGGIFDPCYSGLTTVSNCLQLLDNLNSIKTNNSRQFSELYFANKNKKI